jgi:hypothetical protein
LSATSTSTTGTTQASSANAAEFFNSLLRARWAAEAEAEEPIEAKEAELRFTGARKPEEQAEPPQKPVTAERGADMRVAGPPFPNAVAVSAERAFVAEPSGGKQDWPPPAVFTSAGLFGLGTPMSLSNGAGAEGLLPSGMPAATPQRPTGDKRRGSCDL